MCEVHNQKNANVPKNADKMLFAEDFVNYVLLQFMLPALSPGIAEYRPLIYNAFNPTVRVAANFLYRRLEKEILEEFTIILIEQTLNREAFMSYVTSMELEYLSTGFDAQKLLHFCIKTSTMAVRFYCSGFDEGPALAVHRITNILEDYDMTSGGWDSVNVIAANYARIYVDVDNNLTPDSGSTESTHSSDSGDYSEASDTATATSQGTGDDQELTEPSQGTQSSDSSDDEYSDASHPVEAGEDCGSRSEEAQMELPFPDFKTPCASDDELDVLCPTNSETSSDDEAHYEDVLELGRETPNSVYLSDPDDDCYSDAFEDAATGVTSSDEFGRQSARKRAASSSSSTCGFQKSTSADESSTSLTTPSTSAAEMDISPTPESGAHASNMEDSPVRKHIAKNRKKC